MDWQSVAVDDSVPESICIYVPLRVAIDSRRDRAIAPAPRTHDCRDARGKIGSN